MRLIACCVLSFVFSGTLWAGEQVPILVADVVPGIGSSSSTDFFNVNGKLYFRSPPGPGYLYYVDPATGSPVSTNAAVPYNIYRRFSINGKYIAIYWANATTGIELYQFSENGLTVVKDINTNTTGETSGIVNTLPEYSTSIGNNIYFNGYDPINGYRLWRSDGTTAGTVQIVNMGPLRVFNLAESLYYIIPDSGIYKYNGITSSVVCAEEMIGGSNDLFTINNNIYGVRSGDFRIYKVESSTQSSNFSLPYDENFEAFPTIMERKKYVIGNRVLFFANAPMPGGGVQIWTTDGTQLGTTKIATFSTWIEPDTEALIGNVLYFAASDPQYGKELWRTDGTAAGTYLVKDIYPGASDSIYTKIVSCNGYAYFGAIHAPNEYRLWRSDGTAAGTVITDVMGSGPNDLTDVNGVLYYSAEHPVYGREIFKLGLPTIGFQAASSQNPESTTNVNIAVTLTPSADWSSVDYSVTGGSAANGGVDYSLANGTLLIFPGTTSMNIPIVVTNDSMSESNETIQITLSNPAKAVLGGTVTHMYTIQDDEIPPATPSGLVATPVSGTQINLSWTDNSPNETGFKIERKTGVGGTYAEVGTTAANINTFSSTGLAIGTQYYYRIRSTNAQGNSPYSAEATATTYSLPAAPSGLARTVVSAAQINLTWVDNSNNETGFKIERKTGVGGTYALRATVGIGGTAYSDTGLSQSTTYYYRVRATNTVGDSANSNEVNGTTLTLPSAPSGLAASTTSISQINLSWTDTATNETGFKIERKTGAGGAYSQIGTTGANVTTYSSTGLVVGTQYFFRVRANNAGGNSGYSNEANATTFAPPVAPGSLTATASGLSQINLAWADNSTDETYFKVERKLGAAGTYEVIFVSNANVTSYADTNLSPGRQYYYRVRASNVNGDSSASNEANASTPVPQINVYTVDAFAYEGTAPAGQDRQGKWVLSRSGLTTDAVTVYFRLSGPAKLSTNDYTLSSPNGTGLTMVDGPALSSVTIPAQSSSITFILTPLADAVADPNEAPQIAIVADQGGTRYSIGTSSTGGISITDAPTGGGTGQPIVSVYTVDGEAYEALTTPETYQTRRGSVKFTRSGSTAGSLTVSYSLSGSTAQTNDYTAGRVDGAPHFNNNVVFASGQSEVVVYVDPILDINATESAVETVQYTITSGSYLIGLGASQATVSIYNLPISSFTVNPNPATVNSGVQLLLQTPIAGNHQYFWNFGDSVAYPGGNVQTSTNTVNHVYTAPGTYTVRGWFVVNNYRHVATATLVVNSSLAARSVNQAPSILSAPWVNPNPATVGVAGSANVIAIDPDKGPQELTYSWSKVNGPGEVTFEPNATQDSACSQTTFSVPGTYTIRVTVSDGKDSAEGEVKVFVNPFPKKDPDNSF